MKTLIKTIQRILLIITLAIVLSVGFLFVQEPLVMSRLGGMLLGKKPGVQKIVMSGDGLSIKSNLGEKTINQQTLNEAIAYARETKSHALLVFHQGELQLEEYFPGYDKKTLSDTILESPNLPLFRINSPILSKSLAVASKQQNILVVACFSASNVTKASSFI